MHELGHNLGLHHGGINDAIDEKPNHISIMNSFFAEFGLVIDDASGHYDYSGFDESEIPSLDEQHLDETIGLNAIATIDNYSTFWHCQALGFLEPRGPSRVNQAINWNCLPGNFKDVEEDINGNNFITDTLRTSNEWESLVFDAGSIRINNNTININSYSILNCTHMKKQ